MVVALKVTRLRRVVAVLLGAAVVVGCSSPSLPGQASLPGIPKAWLSSTAEGWPESDGRASSVPVLGDGPCLLGDDAPEFTGATTRFTDVGWGPYGDGDESYRYLCSFWAEEAGFAGELQLIQAGTPEEAQETLDLFLDQPSTGVQENTVETVRSGPFDVHVLSRWYPTNPQGLFQAMYVDESARAIAVLEINSLDADVYDATSPQQIADLLVATFS